MTAVARDAVVVDGFSRFDLGAAIGRDEAVHIGLKAGGVTTSFLAEATKYGGVRKPPDEATTRETTEPH
jgi:hypothetical protein